MPNIKADKKKSAEKKSGLKKVKKKKKVRSKKKAKKKQRVKPVPKVEHIVNKSDNSYRSVPTKREYMYPVLYVNVRQPAKIPEPEPEVIPEETKRRIDWQLNHRIIENAYWKMTKLNQQFPSFRQLAYDTGLSLKAIENHMKDFTMSKVAENFKPGIMIEKVLIGLAGEGANGNAKAGTAFILALAKLGFVKENQTNTDRPDYRDIERDINKDKEISTNDRMSRIHDAILADNALN